MSMCLSVYSSVSFGPIYMDFHKTLYEHYAIRGQPTLYFQSPTLNNTNMLFVQTYEVRVTSNNIIMKC